MNYNKVITPKELKEQLDKNEDLFILDLRESTSFLKPINSAVLIPFSQIIDKIDTLPKDKKLIAYCAHGVDSFFLMNILLADYGFSDIYSLKSGLEGWYKFIKERAVS